MCNLFQLCKENMENKNNILLDVSLDFVLFYNILKDDIRIHLNHLQKDLEKACHGNPNIKLLHTGSGFEDLYIPHNDSNVLNVDSDHMIIRTNFILQEVESLNKTKNNNDLLYREQHEQSSLDSDTFSTTVSTGISNVRVEDQVEKTLSSLNLCNSSDSFNYYMYNQATHNGYVCLSTNLIQKFENWNREFLSQNCFSNSNFMSSSENSLKVFKTVPHSRGKKTGPSLEKYTNGASEIINRDFVFALECKFWPIQAMEWCTRSRNHQWPPKEFILNAKINGCHLVPVTSHSAVITDYEWRLSFSTVEKDLCQLISNELKFGYALLKTVIKLKTKDCNNKVFASYHLKTTLFWYIEINGIDSLQKQSLGNFITGLLDFFMMYYKNHNIPNYFIRSNNMIDHHLTVEEPIKILLEVRSNLAESICCYIDNCHVVPVLYDESLASMVNKSDFKMFLTCCKYNFLVMSLSIILINLTTHDEENVKKSRVCYEKALILHDMLTDNSYNRYFIKNIDSSINLSINDVLLKLEEYLLIDNINIIQKSAVFLGVFNLVLATLPHQSKTDDTKLTKNTEYLTVLFWAAHYHDKYCDRIHKFVLKKWLDAPVFISTDKDALNVSKLINIFLGKPTNQAKAIGGSLIKVYRPEEKFIMMRRFATYLLHNHVESAYIAFQASSYLLDRNIVNEILPMHINSKCCSKMNCYFASKLVLTKDELRKQLTCEGLDKLTEHHNELKNEMEK